MSDINETLHNRGQKYGDFADHASISQNLKDVLSNAMDRRPPGPFNNTHREALSMIAHKMARIVPKYY